jgi:hypothetical protein
MSFSNSVLELSKPCLFFLSVLSSFIFRTIIFHFSFKCLLSLLRLFQSLLLSLHFSSLSFYSLFPLSLQ